MAVTPEFVSDVSEALDELGYAVESEQDVIDDVSEINDDLTLPGIRVQSGTMTGYVSMKLAVLVAYLQGRFETIQSAWNTWFGTDATSGVQKQWADLSGEVSADHTRAENDHSTADADHKEWVGNDGQSGYRKEVTDATANANQKATLADGIYNTVKDWYYGTLDPLVTGFKDTAEGWLQASQAAWNSWFGASASAGVRKTWSDWYTATTTAWDNWFSNTLSTGVRKVWTTWFGTDATSEGSVQKQWKTLSDDAVAKTTAANNAASAANTAAGNANDAATLAIQKAALADEKATLANTKAGYANEQGNYAKAQGDRAKGYNDHPWEIDADGYVCVWDEATQQMIRTNKIIFEWGDLTPQQQQAIIDAIKADLIVATVSESRAAAAELT